MKIWSIVTIPFSGINHFYETSITHLKFLRQVTGVMKQKETNYWFMNSLQSQLMLVCCGIWLFACIMVWFFFSAMQVANQTYLSAADCSDWFILYFKKSVQSVIIFVCTNEHCADFVKKNKILINTRLLSCGSQVAVTHIAHILISVCAFVLLRHRGAKVQIFMVSRTSLYPSPKVVLQSTAARTLSAGIPVTWSSDISRQSNTVTNNGIKVDDTSPLGSSSADFFQKA